MLKICHSGDTFYFAEPHFKPDALHKPKEAKTSSSDSVKTEEQRDTMVTHRVALFVTLLSSNQLPDSHPFVKMHFYCSCQLQPLLCDVCRSLATAGRSHRGQVSHNAPLPLTVPPSRREPPATLATQPASFILKPLMLWCCAAGSQHKCHIFNSSVLNPPGNVSGHFLLRVFYFFSGQLDPKCVFVWL